MPVSRCKRTFIPLWLMLLAGVIALAGCGTASTGPGTGDAARAVLKQTFGSAHRLTSGRLAIGLNLDPGGSSTLTTPITVTFGGPFQTHGQSIPSSDFTATLSAVGRTGQVGLISTGTAGYVTLSGSAYALPATTFRKLESGFSGLAGGVTANGASGLGSLGINPVSWLQHPTVVGSETINGAATTHVHADVNVNALLHDLTAFAGRSSAAAAAASVLTPAEIQKIAASIRNPGFDVWSANTDHSPRKLELSLTVPVTGPISAALGGLKSIGVDLTVQYSQVGQAQTITAPTSLRPFAEFQRKLAAFVAQIKSVASSALGGGIGGASATPGAAAGGGGTPPAYTKCVHDSGGDVAKIQACAKFLNGG